MPFESFSSVHKNNNKNSMAFLEGMLLDSINVVESSFLASLYNQLYDESLSSIVAFFKPASYWLFQVHINKVES